MENKNIDRAAQMEFTRNYVRSFKKYGLIFCLLAAGWFLRGLVMGGPASGAFPGGMPGVGVPPVVTTEPVQPGSTELAKEFVGHVEAIQSVELKAQVDGYIEEVHFQEGSLVNEGDLLFTIRQDQYKAQVELNEAVLSQAKASLERARKYLTRLQRADQRSVSKSDLDTAESDVLQGEAQVQQAKANLELARINLGYTEITSPITGRIGKAEVTKGNYVSPSNGLLARIVQMDPVRVVFSMTDRDYLSILQASLKKKSVAVEAKLRLPDGTLLDKVGERDFEDNQMNASTGTIAVRGRFDNSDGLLVPKSYVTVILERTDAEKALLVPQEAVLETPEGSFVYVVDNKGTVEQRMVHLGKLVGQKQIVLSGLSSGEAVIVQGLQKVRPGIQVAANAK